MDADSGKVCPRRRRFPTSGFGSAAAAPLEPTKRGAGTRLSGAGAARGTGSPRPRNTPARGVQGGNAGDARVAEKSDYCTERTEDARGQPLAPCPSRNPTQLSEPKDPENSESETASRSPEVWKRPPRLSGVVSGLWLRRMCSRASTPKNGWRSLRSHPPRPRDTSLVFFFFTRKSPQPRFPAGTCRALASSRFLPPPAPPPKGNLGPARILWNVLCNLLYICFHGTARCKIAGFRGAGVNCALVSGDVRRTRGGVPG